MDRPQEGSVPVGLKKGAAKGRRQEAMEAEFWRQAQAEVDAELAAEAALGDGTQKNATGSDPSSPPKGGKKTFSELRNTSQVRLGRDESPFSGERYLDKSRDFEVPEVDSCLFACCLPS